LSNKVKGNQTSFIFFIKTPMNRLDEETIKRIQSYPEEVTNVDV